MMKTAQERTLTAKQRAYKQFVQRETSIRSMSVSCCSKMLQDLHNFIKITPFRFRKMLLMVIIIRK